MNIKKCIVLTISIIMMMSATCSAARVRLCDVGLNDFVNYYNRIAKMSYEQQKKIDIHFNQTPFKNLTLSDSNYTAYSCTVGKSKDNIVSVTFYINKSGYISYITMTGNTKKLKQEDLLISTLVLCLLSCGLDGEIIDKWGDNNAYFLFKGSGIKTKLWNTRSKRYVNINSNVFNMKLKEWGKYESYIVEVYATND